MAMATFEDLYVTQLRDLYDAEMQIIQALPKMAEAAHSMDLRDAFSDHLNQTQDQVRRLENIFSRIGQTPQGHRCVGMEGLIKEGEEILHEKGNPDVRDAALIAAAQKVEHYEIAGYGTVRAYAEELGFSDQASMLQESLDQEGRTDKKLTKLAEGTFLSRGINEEASE
jgi:ferritin-like metal-binding protein YciE